MEIMNSKRVILLGLCLCLFSACKQNSGNRDASGDYPLLSLRPESRVLSVKYSAVIEGKQDVDIRPQVSGTLTQVCVEEGARVRKGQVLFIIDQVPYQAVLQKARAAQATAEATLATVQLNLEGKQALYEDKVISDFELRTAQNNAKSAEAALLQAKAEVRDAENNLSYTEVKSPVDGFAGMTSFRVGALVNPSMAEPLLTVSDNSEMYVYFSLTEKQVLSLTAQYGSLEKALKSFPEISLQLNDGSIYGKKGRIDVISGIIDRGSGTVRMRAVFDNKDRRLMSGGAANVVVPYPRENCIVIPQEATFEIQNRIFAYKVVDCKTVSAPIEVFGINDGKEYIVEKGLEAGDVIVAKGAGLLKADMTVCTESGQTGMQETEEPETKEE